MILRILADCCDIDLEERFNRDVDLVKHYAKHSHDFSAKQFKKMFPTPKAYEEAAEELARTPVDHKKIFGYVQNKDGFIRNVKYNKETGLFTAYVIENGEIITITAFLRDYRTFSGEQYTYYFDEIVE